MTAGPNNEENCGPFNDTINTTADRICTQELTIPVFEEHDQANASM